MDEESARRIISKIGIAEAAKIEGFSVTARRILNAGEDETVFEIIKSVYDEFCEDMINGNMMGYFKGIGFTLSLPLSLTVVISLILGTKIKVIKDELLEKQNIDFLLNIGVFNEEEMDCILSQIAKFPNDYKIYSGDFVDIRMEKRHK